MTAAAGILVANSVLGLFLAVICVAIGFGPRPSKALRLLGIGGLADFTGTVVRALQLVWPATFLHALSTLLIVGGLLANSRWSVGRRALAVASAATFPLVTLYLLGVGPALLQSIGSPKSIADIAFTFAALVLVFRPPRDATVAARVLGAGLLLVSALSISRSFVLAHFMETATATATATATPATLETVRGLSLLPLLLTSALVPVGSLWMEVRRAHAELERIAYIDELTGLPNRRATLERFEIELARAFRQKTELALVVFDVDLFKKVNDRHGHIVGDRVLKGLAQKLAGAMRVEDVAGRLGGEEFVVILNGIPSGAAEDAANRLRRDIAVSPIEGVPAAIRPTLSGGIAMFPTDGKTWDELFTAADRRLYTAKQGGRDRVVGPPVSDRASDRPRATATI